MSGGAGTQDRFKQVVESATSNYNVMTDSANRQADINEWAYNDKMDTVFVLQLLFIGLVMISILFYFNGLDILGLGFAWYGTALTSIIVIVIILNRVAYSTSRRDAHSWDRRHFEEDRTMLSTYTMSDPGWQEYMTRALNGFQQPCTTCTPAPSS
jgi:uncharacterized membrane protein